MNRADEYLLYLLAEYRKLKKNQEKELRSLPEGRLLTRRDDKNVYYARMIQSGSKRIRKGITKNMGLVQALARKEYLQHSLGILEKDISALERLLKVHKAPTPDNIMKLLPKSYNCFAASMFLPELRERNQWAAAVYEQSTYRPGEKTHITARGLKVRSKSEVIIADKLDAYGVPFRYEQMLYIENRSFSPDFTFPQQMYWEHCGLVNDPAYMKHHKWKMDMYEKAGIVPWKNLIVTYDDENGGLDARIIEAEIVNKLI